jgi:hypothetical protein
LDFFSGLNCFFGIVLSNKKRGGSHYTVVLESTNLVKSSILEVED